MILKLYRRLQPGIHPELEVARFLTETAGFENTPALLGSVEHVAPDGVQTPQLDARRVVRDEEHRQAVASPARLSADALLQYVIRKAYLDHGVPLDVEGPGRRC